MTKQAYRVGVSNFYQVHDRSYCCILTRPKKMPRLAIPIGDHTRRDHIALDWEQSQQAREAILDGFTALRAQEPARISAPIDIGQELTCRILYTRDSRAILVLMMPRGLTRERFSAAWPEIQRERNRLAETLGPDDASLRHRTCFYVKSVHTKTLGLSIGSGHSKTAEYLNDFFAFALRWVVNQNPPSFDTPELRWLYRTLIGLKMSREDVLDRLDLGIKRIQVGMRPWQADGPVWKPMVDAALRIFQDRNSVRPPRP